MFFVAALWDATMQTVTDKDAATTANTWSGMRVRPQFVEKFFTDPKVVLNKTAKEIRDMNVDDRAILWGKGNSDGDRTLELGANDKFVKGIATPKWNNNYSNGGTPHDSYNFNQFGGSQATYKWELKGGSSNGTTFDKYLNVYPIPSSEILSNKNLTQIDGYNEVQN